MNIIDKYFKGSWSKVFLGVLVGAFIVSVLIYLKTSSLIAGYSSSAAPMYGSYYNNPNVAIRSFPNLSKYDVDLSGQADFNDARFIAAFVAGTGKNCPAARCDISGDGRVTSYDASILTRSLTIAYDVNWDLRLDNQDPAFISSSVADPINNPCPVQRCDINRSGTVTSQDAGFLAQIISTFPAPTTK